MSYGDAQRYGLISAKKIIGIIVVVIVAVAGIGIFGGATVTVPGGYRGIMLTWDKPTDNLAEGFHWKNPFGQTMELVNCQIRAFSSTESAASSDLQDVTTTITVNYHIDPIFALEVYTNLRDQYESRVIAPAVQDSLKASTAKYVASDLITRREDAKNSFQQLLQARLTQYHILVDSVSITNFKFSEQFQAAIDAKVTAEQNALAAQNQLQVVQYQAQQQVINASAEANATITRAFGVANATIIQADATAKAAQIITAQLTPEYVQYLTVLGWDGKLPIYWSGNGTMPFLLIPMTSTTVSNSTSTNP
jgi:regulator of protease activity HflC (stomatin/prohibitin superfamily)